MYIHIDMVSVVFSLSLSYSIWYIQIAVVPATWTKTSDRIRAPSFSFLSLSVNIDWEFIQSGCQLPVDFCCCFCFTFSKRNSVENLHCKWILDCTMKYGLVSRSVDIDCVVDFSTVQCLKWRFSIHWTVTQGTGMQNRRKIWKTNSLGFASNRNVQKHFFFLIHLQMQAQLIIIIVVVTNATASAINPLQNNQIQVVFINAIYVIRRKSDSKLINMVFVVAAARF